MQKQILEIQIQAMAVMTRVEAMKAGNDSSVANQQYPPYGETCFEVKACELESLWQELTRINES